MSQTYKEPHVLSIQSHVVHGYVGNRSAVIPLQFLGYEVDFINSVQFSNHTGYSNIKGQILNAQDLKDLYAGLKSNGLLNYYTHIITGYVSSASFLEALVDIICDMKKINPQLKYYCDPVLGDSGKLYVPNELIEIYRKKVIPLADIIFPNQYEAELLTDCCITNESSALDCLNRFHNLYKIPVVVITSIDTQQCDPDNTANPYIYGYASRQNKVDTERLRLINPRLDAHFTGTGDLFAALSLAHLERRNANQEATEKEFENSFKKSFELVIDTMQSVLKRTLDSCNAQKSSLTTSTQNTRCMGLELKLIQSIDDIRHPTPGRYVEQL